MDSLVWQVSCVSTTVPVQFAPVTETLFTHGTGKGSLPRMPTEMSHVTFMPHEPLEQMIIFDRLFKNTSIFVGAVSPYYSRCNEMGNLLCVAFDDAPIHNGPEIVSGRSHRCSVLCPCESECVSSGVLA